MSDVVTLVVACVAFTFVAVLGFAVQVFGLMYGWGLEPKSWPVIVVASLLQIVLSGVVTAVTKWAKA